jgi:hypothetical protein
MDNLTNFQELYIYHTNPFNPDTDYDNLTDWQELFVYYTLANNSNSDGDLLTDWEEIFVYRTNPLDPDSNDDGYLDGATMEAPRYDWIFHLFFALTSVTAILIALNVRYYLHFRRRKALGEATLIRAETIRKTIKDATWFWGHGAQVLKNFDKQIDNNVKIITLEALTRTWTQHYKKSFQTVFKLSDEEATERAETQKKKEIVELYNLLKDKIDIKVIPIAFGKYAGSDSYQFEVGASQSEQIPKPKDTIPIP